MHFGADTVKPFDDLLAIRAKVLAHAVTLMNLGSNQAFTCSELPKLQGVVFGNQDAIAATVDDAVSHIETICRPFLNGYDDSVLWRKVWNRAKRWVKENARLCDGRALAVHMRDEFSFQ